MIEVESHTRDAAVRSTELRSNRTPTAEMRKTPPHQIVGAGSFAGLDVSPLDRHTCRRIDQRKLHRTSRLSVHESKRWSLFSGDRPFIADLQQRVSQKNRISTLSRQNVFVSFRPGLVAPSFN